VGGLSASPDRVESPLIPTLSPQSGEREKKTVAPYTTAPRWCHTRCIRAVHAATVGPLAIPTLLRYDGKKTT
jgi:hypothetical protein